MPPRLMHKKSRRGCHGCKARKVKCDEARPNCGACQRHRLNCEYPSPGQPTDRSVTVTLGGAWSTGSSAAGIVPWIVPSARQNEDHTYLLETEQRRILELRLMHRYMYVYKDLFPGTQHPILFEVWRDMVPAIAINHPFLLHAMFSTTTLHFVITHSQNASLNSIPIDGDSPATFSPLSSSTIATADLTLDTMKEAYSFYFNLAISGQREAVSRLHPDNADAVCVATILISNQGFLLIHEIDCKDSVYAPPVQWLKLAAAIPTILHVSAEMLGPGSATKRITNSADRNAFKNFNRSENGLFFSPLLEFNPQPDPEELYLDRDAYQTAANALGALRRAIEGEEPTTQLCRRIMAFASLVPAEFAEMVKMLRPRALVILACFFAMTKEVEYAWLFKDVAKKHVQGLKTLLPVEWYPAMEWAEEMVQTTSSQQRQVLFQRSHVFASS